MYTHSEIIKRFYDMADPGYCKFSSSLIPGSKPLIGVRIPYLRVFAKKLFKMIIKVFSITWDMTFLKNICWRDL